MNKETFKMFKAANHVGVGLFIYFSFARNFLFKSQKRACASKIYLSFFVLSNTIDVEEWE